jgi:putative GTP pyrophosphokinase
MAGKAPEESVGTQAPVAAPPPPSDPSPLVPSPIGTPGGVDPPFDFKAHRAKAVADYAPVRPLYELLTTTIRHIIGEASSARDLKLSSIEVRTKSIESFGDKAERPLESDPSRPKYDHPLEDIEDMAGVRAITFLPRAIDQVGNLMSEEFEVLKKEDVGSALRESRRFGYQSIHYIVRLSAARLQHTEYRQFAGHKAEIQVRTVLQHAWAEIEHDIGYKSAATAPESIGRRFDRLAGLLEIADREFQEIQDADRALKQGARKSIVSGELQRVELTSDSLRAYLNGKLGSDMRIADWSYEYEVRRLKGLGFRRLDEIEAAIRGYDDGAVSRALWGSRQGQLTRFESVLIAGMGESYLRRSVREGDAAGREVLSKRIARLKEAGIQVGEYDPGAGARNRAGPVD